MDNKLHWAHEAHEVPLKSYFISKQKIWIYFNKLIKHELSPAEDLYFNSHCVQITVNDDVSTIILPANQLLWRYTDLKKLETSMILQINKTRTTTLSATQSPFTALKLNDSDCKYNGHVLNFIF